MSQAIPPHTTIRIEGHHGVSNALEKALEHQLSRHEESLHRLRATKAPQYEVEKVMTRAHIIRQLLNSVCCPTIKSGIPTIQHTSTNPELLQTELSHLYIELSPYDCEVIKKELDGASLNDIALQLAGWGHRAP